jgi:hypothetical protein
MAKYLFWIAGPGLSSVDDSDNADPFDVFGLQLATFSTLTIVPRGTPGTPQKPFVAPLGQIRIRLGAPGVRWQFHLA